MSVNVSKHIESMIKFFDNDKLSPGYVLSIRQAIKCSGEVTKFTPVIKKLVNSMNMKQPDIKRAIFNVLNYLIQKEKQHMVEFIPTIISNIPQALQIDKSLVKIGEFGAAKIEIDNGKESRKAVYELLNTVCENFPSSIDISQFTNEINLLLELDKNPEIKLMCIQVLTKFAVIDKLSVLQQIEILLPKLKTMMVNNDNKLQRNKDEEKDTSLSRAVKSFIAVVKTHQCVNVSSALIEFINKNQL